MALNIENLENKTSTKGSTRGKGFSSQPEQGTAQEQTQQPEQQPQSGQLSRVHSTAIAHGLRTAMNEQLAHAQGIQEAVESAIAPASQEFGEFIAAAVSGEMFWSASMDAAQKRLAALPKSERPNLDMGQGLKRSRLLSSTLGTGDQGPSLPSFAGQLEAGE